MAYIIDEEGVQTDKESREIVPVSIKEYKSEINNIFGPLFVSVAFISLSDYFGVAMLNQFNSGDDNLLAESSLIGTGRIALETLMTIPFYMVGYTASAYRGADRDKEVGNVIAQGMKGVVFLSIPCVLISVYSVPDRSTFQWVKSCFGFLKIRIKLKDWIEKQCYRPIRYY